MATGSVAHEPQGRGAQRVVLGRVTGPHGVQGWLRVRTFTQSRETLLGFGTWMVGGEAGWTEYGLLDGRVHADGLMVRLQGIADRDAAAALRGSEIAIWRSQLPALQEGEYYWSDLEGLNVFTGDGVALGVVERLFETGANDVMVVRGDRERLIPFVMDAVVRRIDLAAGCIEVDWDAEF